MNRFAPVLLTVALIALGTRGLGGEFNKKLSVGDAAPTWSDLEGTDGKKHSLADLKDKDVVVVAITCNHCPIAVMYEDRLIDFAKKHASKSDSKVAFVAINVNNIDDDKLPAMKTRAEKKKFNFTYLHDPSQKIGKEFGASVTPEFFVLNKDRKVVYMGAMDDNNEASKATTNHLEDAVTAALKGEKPAKAETRGRGCGVKYDK